MNFNLGKPILAMIVIATVTGAILLSRRPEKPTDMVVWTFADTHARSYREPVGDAPALTELFRRSEGRSVGVNLISSRALDVRLTSLFGSGSRDVPDLVEIEIGSVGKYFRPPVDEIGFLPLNSFLERDGLLDAGGDQSKDKILRSRFAPWSKQGVIFGVPNDLHPVTLTYRKDLFDQAGVDIASAKTWDEFQELGLRFQDRWKKRNVPGRWTIELPGAASDYLMVMLLQRHVNVIDDRDRVRIAEPIVADTIVRYAQMVAGPRRIGADSSPGGDLWTVDMEQGAICCVFTPDWRAGFLPARSSALHGRLAMMPLPVFDPSDAPTSTWGGTMIGIPRAARDPEASWRLLKLLYLSPQSLRARDRFSQIIPPVVEHWSDPIFHQPNDYFGGLKIDELYISLAPRIPLRYVTPFTALGSMALARVLADARAFVESHASEPRAQMEAELRRRVQGWLEKMDARVRERIEFGKFE